MILGWVMGSGRLRTGGVHGWEREGGGGGGGSSVGGERRRLDGDASLRLLLLYARLLEERTVGGCERDMIGGYAWLLQEYGRDGVLEEQR